MWINVKKCYLHLGFLLSTILCCADINSTSNAIRFDINGDGTSEMVLNNQGLAIGTETSSANFQVQGNAIISGSLSVGDSTSQSSNLWINGTQALHPLSTSSNVNLSDHSLVMANSASSNLTLRLPRQLGMDGRIYKVKKTSEANDCMIICPDGNIEGASALVLNANQTGAVSLISSANQWHITSSYGSSNLLHLISTPLDLSGSFNMDEYVGPAEYNFILSQGNADLYQWYGSRSQGVGDCEFIFDSTGSGNAYNGLYYSGTQGLPENGIIQGLTSPYHLASLQGNPTLSGNWLETTDPTTGQSKPNTIFVGADHNKSFFQVSEVTVTLPLSQQKKYTDINFILTARRGGHLAMNMQIVALYGDGSDEEVIYAFSTADGGSGPTSTTSSNSDQDFSLVYQTSLLYDSGTAATGIIRSGSNYLYEFSYALPLDRSKTIFGLKIKDSIPSLSWHQRGISIYAATAREKIFN